MRNKILTTAIKILREGGIKKLTQPEVCSHLGMRQSQLTYYYPRRNDLIKAIVEDFTLKAKQRLAKMDAASDLPSMLAALEEQMTSAGAMRGFLGLLIEADQEPAVAEIMVGHMQELEECMVDLLSPFLTIPQVRFTIEHLRGIGISSFLDPKYNSKESFKMLIKLFKKQKQ